jgi:hypothetical protein
MKTTYRNVNQTILLSALLLLAMDIGSHAQTLTLNLAYRAMQNDFASGDAFAGTYYSSYPGAFDNTNGVFNVNDVESSPSAQQLVSAQGTSLLNSTISASATSLNVTGQLQATTTCTATSNNGAESGYDWSSYSKVDITFQIDQPFAYSLQAATSQSRNGSRNAADPNATAFVELGHANNFADIAAYGNSVTYHYTAPTTGGTNMGILPAGNYEFHAQVFQSDEVQSDNSGSENYTASFTLNVTTLPQPPAIVALTPNGAGTFLLAWNAPVTGNYRVMSSTNLTDWLEYIPAASRPSGPNTNTVNVIPGSSAGYFRIQYQP